MSKQKSAEIAAQPGIVRRQIVEKIRAIYVPFLLISVSFIITYSFLNWFLVIKTHVLSINEGYVNCTIPLLLPWVLILFWLRPRLRALQFKNSDNRFLYEIVASLGVAVPAIIAQSYLTTATGKLTHVERVSQIADSAPMKYYSIDEFDVDKQDASVETSIYLTGRRSVDLNFLTFFVAPVYDSIPARSNASPKLIDPNLERIQVWFGKMYARAISNRLADAAKRQAYEQFLHDSLSDFNKLKPRDFSYFERVGVSSNGFQEWYEAAIKKNKHHPAATKPIILVGQSGSFENRSQSAFNWVFGSFGIGATAWFLMLLFPKLDDAKLKGGKRKPIIKAKVIRELDSRERRHPLCPGD